jgi:hypothetical protein
MDLPGILHVNLLEDEYMAEVSLEAVPDEAKVLGHIVHDGAQARQTGAHNCTRIMMHRYVTTPCGDPDTVGPGLFFAGAVSRKFDRFRIQPYLTLQKQ